MWTAFCAHTRHHISFHATWASTEHYTSLNKLYRRRSGERRSHKLLLSFFLFQSCEHTFLCCYFFMFWFLFLFLPDLIRFSFSLFPFLFWKSFSLLFYTFMHIYGILVFVLSPHAFISQWRRMKHEPGKRLWVVRKLCVGFHWKGFICFWQWIFYFLIKILKGFFVLKKIFIFF